MVTVLRLKEARPLPNSNTKGHKLEGLCPLFISIHQMALLVLEHCCFIGWFRKANYGSGYGFDKLVLCNSALTNGEQRAACCGYGRVFWSLPGPCRQWSGELHLPK